MGSLRALFGLLGVAATALGVLHGVTGLSDLALYAAPLLVLLGVLLSGRYPGEGLILGRQAARPRRRPSARTLWPSGRERPLASLLERVPASRRGPPDGLVASA